jgi:hypothetical protein
MDEARWEGYPQKYKIKCLAWAFYVTMTLPVTLPIAMLREARGEYYQCLRDLKAFWIMLIKRWFKWVS